MARFWNFAPTTFTCVLYIVIVATICKAEEAASSHTENSEKVIPSVEVTKRDTSSTNFLHSEGSDTGDNLDKVNAFHKDLSDFSFKDAPDKTFLDMVNTIENGDNFSDRLQPELLEDIDDDDMDLEADKRGIDRYSFVGKLGKRRALPMGFVSQLGKRTFFDSEEEPDVKRAPMGFVGQLGKRSEEYDDIDIETRAPLGFVGQLGKRVPMGFTSQLGKRMPMGFASQLGKRMPMGFASQLGKRMPMGFASQLGKRMPMGFASQLGKRMPMGFASQLGKRMPMGFASQLGKRMPMGFASQLGKRVPMGFTSQLGKRMAPLGFTSQLGKRMPMGFASQLGKREDEEMINYMDDNLDNDVYSEHDNLKERRKRSTQLPWYLSRRVIPSRFMRGIDRYSFMSRLGKRSSPSNIFL